MAWHVVLTTELMIVQWILIPVKTISGWKAWCGGNVSPLRTEDWTEVCCKATQPMDCGFEVLFGNWLGLPWAWLKCQQDQMAQLHPKLRSHLAYRSTTCVQPDCGRIMVIMSHINVATRLDITPAYRSLLRQVKLSVGLTSWPNLETSSRQLGRPCAKWTD